jgi:uracil-DNA glycosylase family 4
MQLGLPLVDVSQCTSCSRHQGCSGPISGEGSGPFLLVFEAPSQEADFVASPLPPPQGSYLELLLSQAGIPRGSTYWTYAVKCYGKSPRVAERRACLSWLDIEVAQVRPKAVVVMGNQATQMALGQALRQGQFGWSSRWDCVVSAWLSPHRVYSGNRALSDLTVAFFRSLREKIEWACSRS